MTAKLDARNSAIVSRYREGASLREVGAEFGISFERVRQVLRREREPLRPQGAHGWSPQARAALVASNRRRKGMRYGMREDLARAVDLVAGGLSFGQVAERVGMTRSAIAGAVYRYRRHKESMSR